MAERFYVSSPLLPGDFSLEGPEAHHLAVVCRLRPGDAVYLFNGDGRQYRAVVEAVERKRVSLRIDAIEAPRRERVIRLEAAVAIPKGDRAAFLVEKLTELGVAVLHPLNTLRSVVHPREAKRERFERQVIEASKQCGRNVLMEVRPLRSWDDLLNDPDLPAQRLLAHPNDGPGEPCLPDEALDTLFAVGPEGGFTDEEVAAARVRGWRLIDLGPRILRIETAALALAAGLQRWQTIQ